MKFICLDDAQDMVIDESGDPIGPTHLHVLEIEDSVATAAKNIETYVVADWALHIWKQLHHGELYAQALQFLTSLPANIVGEGRLTEARTKTQEALLQVSPSPEPQAPRPQVESTPAPAPKAIPEAQPNPNLFFDPAFINPPLPPEPPPIDTAKPTIAIWTGPAYEVWSPENLDTTGIGGSETAAVCMARELRALGHRVTVVGHCNGPQGSKEGIYDDVAYIHYETVLANPADRPYDILVVSRHASVVELPIPRKKAFLWVHDIHVGDPTPQHAKWLSQYDKIFCLSEWHKHFFASVYAAIDPHLGEKIIVTKNGVDLHYFGDPDYLPKKDGNRLIYSSSPDRGLLRLLEFLPEIRESVPDVKLDVFYGFENWKKMAEMTGSQQDRLAITDFERRLETLTKEGALEYHGRVSKQRLAHAFMRAKVWSYCTHFTETFCISALEAQASGCVPVTTALAALNETVSHGFAIKPPDTSPDYRRTFINRVVTLLKDDGERERYARAARKYTFQHHGWDKVAISWQSIFNEELTRPTPNLKTRAPSIEVKPRKLRLACIFGNFSSGLHGEFKVQDLFVKRALTGSESCFFNFIRGMSELGHQVDAVCDTPSHYEAVHELAGAHVYPLTQRIENNYDAFLSWNEPDQLRPVRNGKLRVCVQQLNDFAYCQPGFDQTTDLYVMPSETHRRYLCSYERIPGAKTAVVPNSINLEMFNGPALERDPNALVWSSSPDRGLHIALDVFEKVRKIRPETTLKIFYRFAPWYELVKDLPNETGARARAIHESFSRLGTRGENGVFLMDAQPNVDLIKELRRARAQLYTCEPIRFTEGFGVSVMDASAAGCVPIVSDADSIAEVHKAAVIIPGNPSEHVDNWVNITLKVLSDSDYADALSKRNMQHAKAYHRPLICQQWEKLLLERIAR